MDKAQPIFNPATHYLIEVKGRVDSEWLLDFDSSAKITVQESGQMEDITMLDVHTDQSGIIGLVRRLHGLGITILELQILPEGGKTGETPL
jgi:hypothetical protein